MFVVPRCQFLIADFPRRRCNSIQGSAKYIIYVVGQLINQLMLAFVYAFWLEPRKSPQCTNTPGRSLIKASAVLKESLRLK